MTDRTTTTPETDAPVYLASQSREWLSDAAPAHGDKCSRDDRAGLGDVLKFERPGESIRPSAPQTAEAMHRESVTQELTALLLECTPKAEKQALERRKMQESSHQRHIDAIDAAHETHRAMNAIKGLLIPTGFVPPNESGMDTVNRDDLYALLSIVNGHLGSALEMASGSDGER